MDLLEEIAKTSCHTDCKHWLLAWDGDNSHVVPLNDTVGHEVDDCACIPHIEPIECPDGAVTFQSTHNAWDGRT